MLAKEDCNLESLEKSNFSQPWLLKENTDVSPCLSKHVGSGSGGYCDHIFKYAAKELFGEEVENLEYHNIR